MPSLSRSDILFFYPVALTADEIDGFVARLFDRSVPTARLDAVPLPFSSENPPPLVRVLFFLNLFSIDCLILSFKQDLYPPHQVEADLSDSTDEDQKQRAGDDVEGHGVPLTKPITSKRRLGLNEDATSLRARLARSLWPPDGSLRGTPIDFSAMTRFTASAPYCAKRARGEPSGAIR
jgi:hypothetical protein